MSQARPRVGVLALVLREGEVLLVRRRHPPQAGLWGFPGGRLHWGERLGEGARRELLEETGIDAAPVAVLPAIEVIDVAPSGALRHHYVLVPVLARCRGGAARAGDDVEAAGWFAPECLPQPLSADVPRLIAAARAVMGHPDLAFPPQ
jgi:ADP-ribose pyrophosphatase YjhB (NUDIX family)